MNGKSWYDKMIRLRRLVRGDVFPHGCINYISPWCFSIDASCEREEKKIFFPVSKEQDLFADCSEKADS